jgi:hypothetical protein
LTNWSKRYPWIVETALKKRYKQFVIDGEAVVLGVDGISDFNALHSGKHNDEVQFCAFDILALDGDDLRPLPLSMRKAHLSRLLARRPDGIFISPFEQGDIGPDLERSSTSVKPAGLLGETSAPWAPAVGAKRRACRGRSRCVHETIAPRRCPSGT